MTDARIGASFLAKYALARADQADMLAGDVVLRPGNIPTALVTIAPAVRKQPEGWQLAPMLFSAIARDRLSRHLITRFASDRWMR